MGIENKPLTGRWVGKVGLVGFSQHIYPLRAGNSAHGADSSKNLPQKPDPSPETRPKTGYREIGFVSDPTLPAVLNVDQTAAYLGISASQVEKLLKGRLAGPRLKHARAGRRIIIRRAWLEAWLEASARYEDNKG